jgi:hypothetical protein
MPDFVLHRMLLMCYVDYAIVFLAAALALGLCSYMLFRTRSFLSAQFLRAVGESALLMLAVRRCQLSIDENQPDWGVGATDLAWSGFQALAPVLLFLIILWLEHRLIRTMRMSSSADVVGS